MSETIAKTANTRVFLIEGGARPDHSPSYKSCLRMMAVSQGYGAIERIECPDPYKYGAFIEKGKIKGATEQPTTSLEGRYPQDMLSDLMKLARKGCAFDVQLHTGSCQDPSSFNEYDKALILEGANLTNYATEDLGALASGDNAAINETSDITATDAYEVVPLSVTNRTPILVVDEVLDVIVCDNVSCGGECEDESGGCEKIYAITAYSSGSPNTLGDFVNSVDGGATWYVQDIDGLTSNDPSSVECLGDYVFITSAGGLNLTYALKSEMNGITDATWTQVATGFVAGGGPNDAWSSGSYAFIVGNNGYVYGTSDPTAGVTVLDAGAATVEDLFAVHGISNEFAVAVGENGIIIFTTDGSLWTLSPTSPVGIGIALNTVWVKSETEWFVGTSNGNLYYTLNQGVTWTTKAFSGSGTGSVESVVFPTKSVGFLAHTTAATKGRILRSIDGGNSWKLLPEKTGTMPANDKINALAYCTSDPNFIVGGGLADVTAGGFIVVGSA
ncbi:MAG: hypothetical protein MUO95_05445 [Methanoregula sp.]|nr:hypothetical protein [Methanoregula sp.]